MKVRYLGTAAAGVLALLGQAAAQDRAVLPIPHPPFDGVIAEDIQDSRAPTPHRVSAPTGAPNVLLFMSDDVGFAMSSAFGGPVPTPNFERVARTGQRYNRFHTTGICSPTRAALLTGRNHHAAGNGYLSDIPNGFPGNRGFIQPETATIAQVLRLNGYSTGMWGKHHNVAPGADSPAGPFDSWPTGLGFEYFFGILGGDSDQFNPNLWRGTTRVHPDEATGTMLEKRLADDIIGWVRNQKAAAPDRPFLIYHAPGSTHAPHQAPPEVIARFRGQFDQGWDRLRVETWRRQLAAGVIPPGTKLTERPTQIPAWNSLSSEMRAFAARSMEVAAAQLAYQDEQLGRVLDELERMGELDNTLIALVLGDNGASAEAGPNGTINEIGHMNGIDENPAWLAANVPNLGGPKSYGSYPAGWAWAMNAPLRWTKQETARLGGIRNGMILSWGKRATQPGGICGEFGHVVDLAPTILAAAGLPAPHQVLGVDQKPMDGTDLLASLDQCRPEKPRTQYFELHGKIGLYHDGWFLASDNGRVPWERLPPAGRRPPVTWELYDLRTDFSQSTDVAARHPAKVEELKALWLREAERNQVFPLDHRFATARADRMPEQRKSYTFWGKGVSIPANRDPLWAGRSFTIEADLELAREAASGAVVAVGSHFGGWSLFLDKGRPAFAYAVSTNPIEMVRTVAAQPLPAGAGKLTLRFVAEGYGKPATATILSQGQDLATVRVPKTFLTPAGLGETLDIGRDIGVPVTDYVTHRGELEGEVPKLTVKFD
jgi:arylsulfatase A-like enzyme